MEIFFLFLLLILLNGLFAMSEIALITAKRTRLTRLAEQGDKAALAAMKLGEQPTAFLSTVQIGITVIGVLNGIIGESSITPHLSALLESYGMAPETSHAASTAIVVVSITYLTIVIGELVPKRLGQSNPESVARIVAQPMQLLASATRPFVKLLSFSTDTLLKLMGKHQQTNPSVTEEEIHAMLEEGSVAGIIERQEHEMVRNVFRLDDRQLGSLMVPRSEIIFLDTALPIEENMQRIGASEHSRFPVCQNGLESLLGVINAKQLLAQTIKDGVIDLATHLQPCVYVPETLTGMELLDHFRTSGTQMVFVVDEYGEIQGLVTLQDLLEAVTGEFVPHNLEDSWAVQREDGSWLLDGLIPVPELKDKLNLKYVPEEDKGVYHTLSGMVMWLLGRLPQTGDITFWENWRLEVIDMDSKRIDKVLATKIEEQPAEAPKPVS